VMAEISTFDRPSATSLATAWCESRILCLALGKTGFSPGSTSRSESEMVAKGRKRDSLVGQKCNAGPRPRMAWEGRPVKRLFASGLHQWAGGELQNQVLARGSEP
jgi:hypothetical protein